MPQIVKTERNPMKTDPGGTATGAAAPLANRAVVEGEMRRALQVGARRRERHGPGAATARVLLLRAAPQWRGEPVQPRCEAAAAGAAHPTALALADRRARHAAHGTLAALLTTSV